MRQAIPPDRLLQASLGRLDHALKYPPPPPPGRLFQVELPLDMELREILHSLRIFKNFSDDLLMSEITFDGMPHLAAKCPKLLMKVSAVMSVTKSRCTARVAQHVAIQAQPNI